MRRDPAQRIADALAAIERCQRYVAALDGDADVVETYLPPLADALRSNINVD